MKILITGGLGYLGRALVSALSIDHQIIVIIRKKDHKANKYKKPNVIYYNIEDTNIEKLFSEKKIEIILHTATLYGREGENFTDVVNSNLTFPLELLRLALKNETALFINTDTIYRLPRAPTIY